MADINLRLLSVQDIEMVRSWRNSPEVASYMYNESYITEEQQGNWFNKISKDSNSIYWIIEYESKPLGLASVTGIDRTLNSCYWAFYLGDTSVRGGGIGAKVEFNVLDYVFTQLNLNKLRCEVFVSNDKVIKMHEKFGFRREAYYREHCIKNNVKLDVVGLAILKSEWENLRDLMRIKIYGQ
jgi:UDP-4-amino-4,6-dideoxy-N-acetyl-beta-L-altrosamine N-acetyltransferase